MHIRPFTEEDFPVVCSWWKAANEPVPDSVEYMPPNTYIIENEQGVPWVCLSLVFLWKPALAWSLGLVSNPELKEHRKEAVKELWAYVANLAKKEGYENLFCVAINEKLENRYTELGFLPTKKNVTLMVKHL